MFGKTQFAPSILLNKSMCGNMRVTLRASMSTSQPKQSSSEQRCSAAASATATKKPQSKIMLRILFFLLCSSLLLIVYRAPAVAEQQLTIGSPAPALDIENWIHDGNGFFKPVTKLEKDKVYVVEFWATWCGPCIMSMPHLAETQEKFRGRGVQIISVSDESPDEVESLLSQKHPQVGKTFDEITSAYCLTSDPDRSVHDSYMKAANQNAIPTSFIVGKTGKIEWIGHPASMDEPLEKIVEGTWDREQFKVQFESQGDFEKGMEKLFLLARAGKIDDAIKLTKTEEKKAAAKGLDDFATQWRDVRYDLMVSSGNITDEVVAYYREYLESIKDKPMQIAQFGYSLYDAFQQGGDLGPLDTDVITALTESMDKGQTDDVFVFHTIAQLYEADKQLDEAIQWQQKAIDATGSDERQKKRLVPYLESLQAKSSRAKKADKKETADDK